MLLEFELENDGTFATASSISLVASKLRDETAGRVVTIGDAARTEALTAALILGKNGSGKSTLVRAMRFVSSFVKTSANESQRGEKIGFEPNLLIDGKREQSTRYRVAFSMHGTVYDFEFSHNADRITYERLSVADRSIRFRKMYERNWSDKTNSYSYSFGEALTGHRTVWQQNTRENALFISTAAQLNSDDIKPAFDWLSQYLRATNITSNQMGGFTAKKCKNSVEYKDRVVTFLQAMDINVEDIVIEEEPIDPKFLESTFSSEFINLLNKNSSPEIDISVQSKVFFFKKNNNGELIKFPISKESTGTRALFNLAGPLFDSLENGYCLLIDEINTSLHPLVVSFLIDLFSDEEINRLRAQLIFTSHDTSILSGQRLRRDQVWVIDKVDDSAVLVPISDFSPRRLEALDKGYLGGRYGGVPVLTPALLMSTVKRH